MNDCWKVAKLGRVCDFQNGFAFKSSEYSDGGHFVIRIGNVQDGYIELNNPRFVRLKEDKLERFVLFAGDILVSLTGNVGRVGIISDHHLPAVLNQRVARIKIRHEGELAKDYLFYFLRSSYFLKELIAAGHGAAQQNISTKDIEQLDIPVPPIGEQKRIVATLDETFEAIDKAKQNTEKNLQNARELFTSYLRTVFDHGDGNSRNEERNTEFVDQIRRAKPTRIANDGEEASRLNSGYVTKTGGRDATLRHIPGRLSLSVGMPKRKGRAGWRWSALSDLARLESGHTPSRRFPEYWGGSIPWIGIQDARENHGNRIADTFQKTNELGIANSSARVLPEDTVCLSRTASVGYVVVMGSPMATSQDFVNWVCSDQLKPDFLKYLFLAEGRDGLLQYASGSVHQTIYFPEAKAFHICLPDVPEQQRIIRVCDSLRSESERLEKIYRQKLVFLDELKKSLLHRAFAGKLSANSTARPFKVSV